MDSGISRVLDRSEAIPLAAAPPTAAWRRGVRLVLDERMNGTDAAGHVTEARPDPLRGVSGPCMPPAGPQPSGRCGDDPSRP
jgi:hypothetical protein